MELQEIWVNIDTRTGHNWSISRHPSLLGQRAATISKFSKGTYVCVSMMAVYAGGLHLNRQFYNGRYIAVLVTTGLGPCPESWRIDMSIHSFLTRILDEV